ncbi:MAG: hypothetical protein IJW36_01405 [Clostridia bacterium]|nr:hypothetical protein [Clostridia bacterium]
MKKLIIVSFIFLILIVGVDKNSSFSLLNYFSGDYTVYTSTSSETGVDLGFCYMNSNPSSENVVGESLVVENFAISNALSVLNARVVKTEYLEDGTTVIYAYTNLINKKVKLDNKNVNLQIATKNDRTVIGWPLILGSF